MSDNFDKKLAKLQEEIDCIKLKLDTIENNLTKQEKVINNLIENTDEIIAKAKEAIESQESIEKVMKIAFPSGRIPKILSETI